MESSLEIIYEKIQLNLEIVNWLIVNNLAFVNFVFTNARFCLFPKWAISKLFTFPKKFTNTVQSLTVLTFHKLGVKLTIDKPGKPFSLQDDKKIDMEDTNKDS